MMLFTETSWASWRWGGTPMSWWCLIAIPPLRDYKRKWYYWASRAGWAVDYCASSLVDWTIDILPHSEPQKPLGSLEGNYSLGEKSPRFVPAAGWPVGLHLASLQRWKYCSRHGYYCRTERQMHGDKHTEQVENIKLLLLLRQYRESQSYTECLSCWIRHASK